MVGKSCHSLARRDNLTDCSHICSPSRSCPLVGGWVMESDRGYIMFIASIDNVIPVAKTMHPWEQQINLRLQMACPRHCREIEFASCHRDLVRTQVYSVEEAADREGSNNWI